MPNAKPDPIHKSKPNQRSPDSHGYFSSIPQLHFGFFNRISLYIYTRLIAPTLTPSIVSISKDSRVVYQLHLSFFVGLIRFPVRSCHYVFKNMFTGFGFSYSYGSFQHCYFPYFFQAKNFASLQTNSSFLLVFRGKEKG